MVYIIIVGVESPVYSSILKCERSGQNLIFSSIDEAQDRISEITIGGSIKARAVAL